MYIACTKFRNKTPEKRRPGAAHFYVEGDAGPDGRCDAGSGSGTAAGQQIFEKGGIPCPVLQTTVPTKLARNLL